jgi:hypothetical protein
MALTPRGRALRWLTNHRGITESPAGSNRDNRKDGITAAQKRLGAWLVGQPWCGVWACNAALEGGVKIAKPYRWAAVANIEDDARARTNGFLKWVPNVPGEERGKVMRADLAVMFGRGCMSRRSASSSTTATATSSRHHRRRQHQRGPGGSQANGGGAFRRVRPISDVYGFARVNYPEA